jgi:hypothetical protein
VKNIFKKISLMAIGSLIGIILYKPVFGQDLIVTPIIPIPGKVVEGTIINNIQYQITNTSAGSLSVTFDNLNAQSKTYTTTCGTVAAAGTCLINIIFNVPALPAGKTSEWYPHTFKILGGSSPVPYGLGTTIVESEASITPTFNISLSDGTSCASETFDVTLTPATGSPTVYNAVACGKSSPTPAIAGGTYTLSVTPLSVISGVKTFDAPKSFPYHIAKSGDSAAIVYALNQDIAVSTNLTMPNVGPETSAVTCLGAAGTFGPHNQGAGSQVFDNMPPGSYTCTAANYTGTDGKIYSAAMQNPYVISALPGQNSIAATFNPKTPTTEHVTTALTTPGLAAGGTVAVTLTGSITYGPHNQPTGNAPFDVVEDGSYAITCAPYTVGPDTYSATPTNPLTINSSSTVITCVYSKNAPPGTSYNWNVNHLTALKNANVALISWGGGHTTAPIHTSTNPEPNPSLVSLLATYENSPTTLLSTAQIQGFPGYIAMGTISEPTTAVTNQLKDQKLDFTNKYEAPFGNSPGGCYYQQQNANGASGGNQKDYWYNANQAAGLQPLNWTTTPTATNLIPAGTYVIAGDLYIVNQSLSVWEHIQKFFGAKVNAGFVQYIGKIGKPVQVDETHVTIPETFTALPPNSSIGRPNLANNQTVTFTVPTYVSTNITFGAQPPASGTSLINLAENMCGSYFYTTGGYTPVVNDVAAQAKAVKTATGHNIVGGIVFYTVPMSVSNDQIIDSFVNDYNVQTNLYNLATEALLMQNQYTTNGVNMALLLNPDTTNIFQNCAQWYCAIQWKKGLTQDTTGLLVQIPNLAANLNAVIDRMVAYSQLTSGQATTIKAAITSTKIMDIPAGSGLTAPGMQNFFLASNFLIKQLAPNVPFGYGFNIYDNANPLMAVGTPPVAGAPWETASITWIHKVNHSGYSPTVVAQAIQFEANKDATFMKDLNFADYLGNPYTALAPDFMFRDRFEEDVIYSEVGQGYLLNGVDWDSYMEFITGINNGGIIKPIPTMLWQMPGASLQVQGATWPSNALGDDMVDWTFGNTALHNDFSNIAACTTITPSPATLPCNWYGTAFAGYLNTSVYFTNNSGVNNTIDYLKLTSSSP